MTQVDLAVAINKSFNYINSIENSVFFPPPETIEAIATVLKIKPVQLFYENSSFDAVLLTGRKKIINDVSEILYTKLKADIYRDIKEVLSQERSGEI
jgi:transcriptional regulator with XRE-family HTH domain